MATQTGRQLIEHAKRAATRARTARDKELHWRKRRGELKAEALKAVSKLTREDRLIYSEQITKIICAV